MPTRSLPERILCLVTDIDLSGGKDALLETIDIAVGAGVNMVQVRAHALANAELSKLAEEVAKVASGRALTVVNGPVAAALAAKADGVHVPESKPVDSAAKEHSLLAGKSAHSVSVAQEAVAQGVDYLVLGTIFSSRSHPGGATGGTELIRQVTGVVSAPVIAIGGITTENAASAIREGARGVAVISAIIGQADPASATRKLADAIHS